MYASKVDMLREEKKNMRGGSGSILLDTFDAPNPKNCRLIAVITVEPGCSIGSHAHDGETEIFYVLEGQLQADDNGTDVTLYTGDALYTGGGASHSVKNVKNQPAKMLAVIITE